MSETTSSLSDAPAGQNQPGPGARQSQADKDKNFEAVVHDIGHKMEEHPESITAQDANKLKSAEAKHTGIRNPPADSISATAARLVAAGDVLHQREAEAKHKAHEEINKADE